MILKSETRFIMGRKKSIQSTPENTYTSPDAARFLAACDRIIHTEHIENGIGTLSEKTVHSVLKHYLEPEIGRAHV